MADLTVPSPSPISPVLLYDGVCNLCDRSVQFVLDHEAESTFRFAALQSDVGRRLADAHGIDADALASLVVVDGGRVYTRSDAALRIAQDLRAPWRALQATRYVPRVVRDAVYDLVASNRYRWFGTRDACRIPTSDVAARFLDAA